MYFPGALRRAEIHIYFLGAFSKGRRVHFSKTRTRYEVYVHFGGALRRGTTYIYFLYGGGGRAHFSGALSGGGILYFLGIRGRKQKPPVFCRAHAHGEMHMYFPNVLSGGGHAFLSWNYWSQRNTHVFSQNACSRGSACIASLKKRAYQMEIIDLFFFMRMQAQTSDRFEIISKRTLQV